MLTARGVSGEVRKGYHLVARLSEWSLANDRIDATASDVNQFWIGQGGPFVVRLKLGSTRWWVWRTAEILDPSAAFSVRIAGMPDKCV